MKKLRVLQVGDFSFDFYDQALYEEFFSHGSVEVEKFEWKNYFNNYKYTSSLEKLYYGLQNRYKFGPVVWKLNSDLLLKVESGGYDALFIWRGIHLYPSTLNKIKLKNIMLIGYNNDETFSLSHPWWSFRLLKKGIEHYDHFFVYRESDKLKILSKGVSASIFMPTFDKSRVYPILEKKSTFDIAFIGHFENDGRDELMLKILKAGFRVKLSGQRWGDSPLYPEITKYTGDITPAYNDYNEAINSAHVCLSFLSKLNNDKYTRRTLEIPATKTVMLAEYTDEQAKLFIPDEEAIYFKTHGEAIEKLRFLLKRPELLSAIAERGYQKVMGGPYQLGDRVEGIIDIVNEKLNHEN